MAKQFYYPPPLKGFRARHPVGLPQRQPARLPATGKTPMTWSNIVGRKFSAAEFDAYVRTLKFDAWRPSFVVVHNTSEPTRALYAQWQARNPPVTMERWLQNLVGYYRDQQGWSGGPHLFVADDGIGVFTPLTGHGTHTPSWNSVSWGVETVGEFESESFDGPVRDNLISALVSLHSAAGLDPANHKLGVRGLHFHKEDVATTHRECPGRHMVKADLVAAVVAKLGAMHGGEHAGDRPLPAEPAHRPLPAEPAPAPPAAPAPAAAAAGAVFCDITATCFGGAGDPEDSAYGGKVDPSLCQVALPARLPAGRRTILVARGDKKVVCHVNDVGPWNTSDAYWAGPDGRPAAEQQHVEGSEAQNGSVPSNPAGIDMTPAVFTALGIGPHDPEFGQTTVDWEFAP